MESHKVVRPEHLNHFGYLFGGFLLKWVDEISWIAASRDYPGCSFVTVTMDKVEFRRGVRQGTVLRFDARESAHGTTSVEYASRSSPTTSKPAPRRRSSPPTSASSVSTPAGPRPRCPSADQTHGHPAAGHGHHRPGPYPGPGPTPAAVAPSMRLDTTAAGPATLRLGGTWRVERSLPEIDDLARDLDATTPAPTALTLDCAGLTDWDSGLVAYLLGARDMAMQRNLPMDEVGLPDGCGGCCAWLPRSRIAQGVSPLPSTAASCAR